MVWWTPMFILKMLFVRSSAWIELGKRDNWEVAAYPMEESWIFVEPSSSDG